MTIIRVDNLNLPDSVKNDLIIMAMTGMPYEVCGLIHPHNIVHQYQNTFCGDRKHGFDMEVDIRNDTIKAVWHSHPTGPSEPSKDDYACMQQLAEHGFNFPWIIVTTNSITEWLYEPLNVLSKLKI
jgi:proteasome lid subunit RPN8/RPN11